MLKVRLVILSNLSDAQEYIGYKSHAHHANERINFAKYLVLKYPNMDTEINPDEAFDEFCVKHPSLVQSQLNIN